MESLTQEQLAYIERHGKTKNPKTIAKDLKLELRHVQSALKSLKDPRPAEAVTLRFTPDAIAGVAFAVAIVVLGWLAYANNLSSGWHFDDAHSVLANDAIKNPTFAGIYKLNNYRQVLYWVFAGSWSLHQNHVRGWHIENNLIHLVNGLLVYAFTYFTLRTPAGSKQTRWPHAIAGLTGAIFVLHPLQTQAVTYITQRTESLCATFYLTALILYVVARVRRVEGKARGSVELAVAPIAAAVSAMILAATFLGLAGKLVPFLVVSALAFAGALGVLAWLSISRKIDPIEAALFGGALVFTLVACETKEIAGTIPAAMLLWELVFMRPATAATSWLERARAHVSAAPYAAMLLLLPLLAVAVGLDLRLSLRDDVQSVYDIKQVSGKQYVLTQLNVLATYVRLYLLPWGQSLDWDYAKRSGLFDGPTFLSLLALLGAVGVAVRVRRTQPVFTFAVFFMLGVLAPTSLFVLPDFIFEHRVYLPLAAAAFVSALLVERVLRAAMKDEATARKAFLVASVPILAVLILLTHSRNEVWATDETLWHDAATKHPNKPRPLTNLGLYYQNVEPQYLELKNGERAGGIIEDGAKIGKPDVWIVRSIFANMTGAPQDRMVPKAVVARGPIEWGGLEKASKMYLRALEIDPDYYKARNNYALCVIQQGTLTVGNAQEALRAFFQLQQQDPNDPRLPKLKEFIDKLDAEALAKFKKGEAELLEILRRHPDDNVTLMNLGNLYFGYLDRLDDAVDMVDKSIVQNDREPMAFAVSGEIYFSRGNERVDAGRSDEAMADYRKAIERYREYLARVGQSRDPDNYKHILERKTKCEQALKERKRAEPKREGFGTVNPFQNAPGQGSGRVTRWKPKASSQ